MQKASTFNRYSLAFIWNQETENLYTFAITLLHLCTYILSIILLCILTDFIDYNRHIASKYKLLEKMNDA